MAHAKRSKPVRWSKDLAYAVGLIATDGNLSPNGRHIELTSRDRQQLQNLMRCLDISVKIGTKRSGDTDTCTERIQFGDVVLYTFLLQIGLTPNKTKTIAALSIPDAYFFDFLRGHFDGDGSFYSYHDPRWPTSFQYYMSFVSASHSHILWLEGGLLRLCGAHGYVAKSGSVYQLRYGKRATRKIVEKMYYRDGVVCLHRKRNKVFKAVRKDI